MKKKSKFKAIILYGPSGVGKSTIAGIIAKNHHYKHCDVDEFKWLFSHERSKERTEIGEYMVFIYAKKLIKRKHNIIIEALSNLSTVKKILKKEKYEFIEISLKAPLQQCIQNNATRKRKGYKSKVIREIYYSLNYDKGYVFNVEGKIPNQVYAMIRKKVNL